MSGQGNARPSGKGAALAPKGKGKSKQADVEPPRQDVDSAAPLQHANGSASTSDTGRDAAVAEPSAGRVSTAISDPDEGAPPGGEEGKRERPSDVKRLFHNFGLPHNSRALKEFYAFWESQPVPQLNDEEGLPEGPISGVSAVSEISTDPLKLPPAYEWVSCDVSQDAVLEEVYRLLVSNYVEDDDNMFRFKYSVEFLRWALMPPGYRQDWHVGVRATATKKLFGFITAVPAQLLVHCKEMATAEINFLCVHKKLRGKRLSPILIREVTRRVNLCDTWQAVYTAGIMLPTPISVTRYWHRSINPRKLIEVGFSGLAPRMTMARTLRLYKLPARPETEGFRQMESADVPQVHRLLRSHLAQYAILPALSEEDVAHWLLPRPGVVDAFVVEAGGSITDFVSFYTLPSSVLQAGRDTTLMAAYLYYYVPRATPVVQLINDALIMAKVQGYDVFNALDIMQNGEFLKELKFGIGDGTLQYYLYNWRLGAKLQPSDVGLVML